MVTIPTCPACRESTGGTCPEHPRLFHLPDGARWLESIDKLRTEERARVIEECAKVAEEGGTPHAGGMQVAAEIAANIRRLVGDVIRVAVDPSMPPGVAEFRDADGYVRGRITGIGDDP